MIVTTTPEIAGRRITEYKGLVSGETIVGANIVKDLFAGIRDLVGGRSAAYEKTLADARNMAMEQLVSKAEGQGANAVVGIDLDYETMNGTMLMVTISGTAVVAVRQ